MKHVHRYRKLGRDTAHRRSMLRNLATSFFIHGRITTTWHRAKEAQPIVEKLITQSLKAHRQKHLGARRKVMNYLHPTKASLDFFHKLASFEGEHTGGLTRVVRLGELRKGDGAVMAVLMATEAITDPGAWKELQQDKNKKSAPPQITAPTPENTFAYRVASDEEEQEQPKPFFHDESPVPKHLPETYAGGEGNEKESSQDSTESSEGTETSSPQAAAIKETLEQLMIADVSEPEESSSPATTKDAAKEELPESSSPATSSSDTSENSEDSAPNSEESESSSDEDSKA